MRKWKLSQEKCFFKVNQLANDHAWNLPQVFVSRLFGNHSWLSLNISHFFLPLLQHLWVQAELPTGPLIDHISLPFLWWGVATVQFSHESTRCESVWCFQPPGPAHERKEHAYTLFFSSSHWLEYSHDGRSWASSLGHEVEAVCSGWSSTWNGPSISV